MIASFHRPVIQRKCGDGSSTTGGTQKAMLGLPRRRSQRGRHTDGRRRANPAISGFPKPLPIRWSKRLRAAISIYATFRPMFRLGGRWSASIPS